MNEYTKAREWRIRNKLSVDQLSAAIGYAPEVIYAHERHGSPPSEGRGRPRSRKVKPPTEFAWLRYKRVCGDLDAEMRGRKKGNVFSW